MRSRQLAFIVVTVLIACGATLLLAEVVLRAVGVRSRLVYSPNPYYGWAHTAGDRFVWTTDGHDLEIEINALGLRDHDYAYDKPAGVARVLVLGDSFPEALQVPLEQSFSKQLETALNGGLPGARTEQRVEVINAGVSGYGTDNALLFFTNEGYKYSPDVVLLAFYLGNDVRNNWYPLEELDAGGARKPFFDLGPDGLVLRSYPFAQHASWSTRIKVFLNRHLRLYSFTRELLDQFRTRRTDDADVGSAPRAAAVPLDLQLFATEPSSAWAQAWQVTAGLLSKLEAEVEGRDARLLVAIVPTAFQVHPQLWTSRLEQAPELNAMDWSLRGPDARLGEICVRGSIRCIDLLGPLDAEAVATGNPLYFANDGHWNEAGHRAAALSVAPQIAELLRR